MSGVFLKEICSVCINSFESHRFLFAPRSFNAVAKSLAQHGLRADAECLSWGDDVSIAVLVASESAEHIGNGLSIPCQKKRKTLE